jgi:hypothetical protein
MGKAKRAPVVDAGRIAASRRVQRGAKAPPKKERTASGGRGRKGSSPSVSPLLKGLKLAMIVVAMAGLGFCAVFIIDVGLGLMGSMRVGTLTASELVDKISDRVFDEDVPERRRPKAATPQKKAVQKPAKPTTTPPTPETPRAPLPAPRPEVYQAEANVEVDPEVERARARLDQLLKGL